MLATTANTRKFSVPAITVTGFSATIAQILVLRELLVFFYGNELSAGLVFAGWLFGNAAGSGWSAKWFSKRPLHPGVLGGFLILLALMLPVTVLFIRAAGLIWAIPTGEMPSLGEMLIISFSATGLFCPVSGALFGICWACHRLENNGGNGQPIVIYLGEALGATAGGLIFYFVFLPLVSAYTAVWMTSALVLIVSGWILRPWRNFNRMTAIKALWLGVSFFFLIGALGGSHIDSRSRQWQWGPFLLAVEDTAYHNIAVVQKNQQVSVFTNGLWLFSTPDPLSNEHAIHPALLQHPHPKSVLLIGGGISGQLLEIFKHPGIEQVDYLEPDAGFIPFVRPFLPEAIAASLNQPNVHLYNQDAGIFMRRHPGRYDVILMNRGDPINAQMNRFYTREFFAMVKNCLMPGGVFSFAVSGGEDIMGPGQARFLASFQKTLHQIFPRVVIFPGERTRFFAGDHMIQLVSDARTLLRRIAERGLRLSYIRADTLENILNPFRLDYLKSILGQIKPIAVNRDFVPTCYFNNMVLWGFQWHPKLRQLFLKISQVPIGHIWIGLTVAGALIVLFFWTGPSSRFRTAAAGSVAAVGAAEIVVQMVLLLGFQIVAGFLYVQLALIIAFFMAGLAIGAVMISVWQSKDSFRPVVIRWGFIIIQILVALFPLGFMLLLFNFQNQWRHELSLQVIGWIFSGIALIVGVLGGSHFSLVVFVLAGLGESPRKIGGKLYAFDLAGSAAGVLVAVFITLPIFGLINTLLLVSAVTFISILTLLRLPDQPLDSGF